MSLSRSVAAYLSVDFNWTFYLNVFYDRHSAPVIEETTAANITSTSNDHNGLTLSTNSAPITKSTRSSTTSRIASSTTAATTEITEHHETSTTSRSTDLSINNQTSTDPISVRYVRKKKFLKNKFQFQRTNWWEKVNPTPDGYSLLHFTCLSFLLWNRKLIFKKRLLQSRPR